MNKYNNTNFGATLFLCFLLPPFFSTILALYKFYNHKNIRYGLLLCMFGVLFVMYNIYSVDNVLRLWNAYDKYSTDLWYMGDPLTNLIRNSLSYGLGCSTFFYIYIISIYIFWLYTLKNTTHYFTKSIVIIFVFGMILRNAVDLVYYTLSLTATLYLVSKKEVEVRDYLYIIPLVYILHPGFFIILVPSIFLYYIIKKQNNFLYFSYSTLLFIIFFLFNKIQITNTGIALFDNLIESFKLYTDAENKWGAQEKNITGFWYFLKYYGMATWYMIIYFYTFKYRYKLPQKHIIAIFQTAIIALPNLWNFVTLSERIMTVLSLTSWLCLIQLQSINNNFNINNFLKKGNYLALISIIIFTLNLFKFTPIRIDRIFRNNNYMEIKQRSFYVPSILLFNQEEFGFSDSFVKQNTTLQRFQK